MGRGITKDPIQKNGNIQKFCEMRYVFRTKDGTRRQRVRGSAYNSLRSSKIR